MTLLTSISVAGKAAYRYFVPAQKFELVAQLYGHRDSIHAVEASGKADGTIVIASAGQHLANLNTKFYSSIYQEMTAFTYGSSLR